MFYTIKLYNNKYFSKQQYPKKNCTTLSNSINKKMSLANSLTFYMIRNKQKKLKF